MQRLDAVTLKQLKALQAIAEHGSFAAAADGLGLTAPSVHSQIKALETALSVPVLQRAADGGGSRLTPAGQAMLEAYRQIDVTLSQAGERVAALSRGLFGQVTLGVVSTAQYFAPWLAKAIRTLHADIDLVLRIGNRDQVIDDIATGAVDLAIMGRPPREPLVEAMPIGPNPHGLIAAPDHTLAGRRALSGADLHGETFLTREQGSGTRILTTRYLDRIGEGFPYRQMEVGTNEAIKQAVMAGLGIAFLSLHTVTDELRYGRLVLLDAPQLPLVRHWFVVWPQGRRLTAAGEAVSRTIIRLEGSFLPKVDGLSALAD